MKEKIVIIFIALVLGLFITTIAFYIYESTKTESQPKKEAKINVTSTPTPTPVSEKLFLTLDSPSDEALVDEKVVEVKGKTNPLNTVVISSNIDYSVLQPDSKGVFSSDVAIDQTTNIITVLSITPQGEDKKEERVVTFSQEEF